MCLTSQLYAVGCPFILILACFCIFMLNVWQYICLSVVPTLPQEGTKEPCTMSPRVSLSQEGRRRISCGSSRRTSRLTCAQLLALSGTQGAALAASCASNFAVHRFCSGIGRGKIYDKYKFSVSKMCVIFALTFIYLMIF